MATKRKLETKQMNEIKRLRYEAGMTQQMFSDFFGIPVRTLQDWENERRTPPDYLVRLLPYKLKLEWDYKEHRKKGAERDN